MGELQGLSMYQISTILQPISNKFTQRFPFFLALIKVENVSIVTEKIYFQKAKQIIRNFVYDVLL